MGIFSGIPPGYDVSIMEYPEGSGVFYWSLVDPDGNEAPSYARFGSSSEALRSGIAKARKLYRKRIVRAVRPTSKWVSLAPALRAPLTLLGGGTRRHRPGAAGAANSPGPSTVAMRPEAERTGENSP